MNHLRHQNYYYLLLWYWLQECCESGEDCVLDLLDYCQRNITRLLVQSEGEGGWGKMVESEGSSSEDDDGDNVPSKKKILMVRWREGGRGEEKGRERRGRERGGGEGGREGEREREREGDLIFLISTGTQRTGANTSIQCQYESIVNSPIHQWSLISVSSNYLPTCVRVLSFGIGSGK